MARALNAVRSRRSVSYFSFIFPSTIVCFHFLYSALTNLAPSSGEVPCGDTPTLASDVFSPGEVSAFSTGRTTCGLRSVDVVLT